MQTISIKLIIVVCSILVISNVQAQVQTYRPGQGSYIRVEGTSTLHDWEMRSEDIEGEISLIMNGDGVPEELESLNFRLKKTSLKSSMSGLERRAYNALNAATYPDITFRLTGRGDIQTNGEGYIVSTRGVLTVAGQTMETDVEAICFNGDDNKLVCSGSQNIKMTDFQIDPPVMMLGALRTVDEVTVNFRVVYMQ